MARTPKGPKANKPEINIGTAIGVDQSAQPFMSNYKGFWETYRYDDVTVAQLVDMRKKNGQARALYSLITLPIRNSLKTASFIPSKIEEGGQEEADFIRNVFTLPPEQGGLETPFSLCIAALLLGVFDGFAALEQVFHSPDNGPLKGKWTLQDLEIRPSQTLTFLLDDHGKLAGVRQLSYDKGKTIDAPIPKNVLAIYTCHSEERRYYGRSMFESAFYHYDKIVKLEFIAHLAAQRAAVGTRIGHIPAQGQSDQATAKFLQALANLNVAQWIALPPGYEIEIQKEGGTFDFLEMIKYHNSQMSKSVLAAFFDDDQGGNSSMLVDFGKQSDSHFTMMIDTIMSDIAAVINHQIIPQIIRWNFGPEAKMPTFEFGMLTEEDKSAIKDTWDKLMVAGPNSNATPEFTVAMEEAINDIFSLGVDYPAIKIEQEAAKAKAVAAGEQYNPIDPRKPMVQPPDPIALAEAQAKAKSQYGPDTTGASVAVKKTATGDGRPDPTKPGPRTAGQGPGNGAQHVASTKKAKPDPKK